RFWARRAPTAERISASVATVLVVVLLAWLLVPGSGPKPTNLASGGGASGEGATGAGQGGEVGVAGAGPSTTVGSGPGAGAAGGPAGNASRAGAAAGSAGGAGGGLAPGCPGASGVTGVSATQIKVAVTLTNIVGPAANSIFGIASPADQQKWYEAQLDDINKKGGIACRKVVPTFYPTNPTD